MAEINAEADERLSAKVSELINRCDVLIEKVDTDMQGKVEAVEELTNETEIIKNETASILETFKEKLALGEYKGEKGDTGEKGEKGDKGDTGEKGDKGDIGDFTHLLPLSISMGGTGADTVDIARENLMINNVDNTKDIDKPISTAMQNALNMKQDVGDYATNEALNQGLDSKQPVGDYATNEALNQGLASKQPVGDYATNQALQNGLNSKQPKGNYLTSADIKNKAPIPTTKSGVGQIHRITKNDVNSTILPAGGTWLVYRLLISSATYSVSDVYIDLYVGGSNVKYNHYSVLTNGFAWRIA